jgi:hypothetical protein
MFASKHLSGDVRTGAAALSITMAKPFHFRAAFVCVPLV